jgi:hypothetical protein
MKSTEIIVENNTTPHSAGVKRSLPKILVFPNLTNQDAYLQYRFGLAMASAGAVAKGEVKYQKTNEFGEQLVVVPQTQAEEDIVNLARKIYKVVSSPQSEEATDVINVSPVAKRKKNKYGV